MTSALRTLPAALAVVVLCLALAGCGQRGAHTAATAVQQPAAVPTQESRPGPVPTAAAQPPASGQATAAPVAPRASDGPVAAAAADPASRPAARRGPRSAAPSEPPSEPTQPAEQPDRRDRSSQPEDPGAQLVGRGFSSVAVTEGGKPRRLVEGTRIEVAFERRDSGDVVRWMAGCNRAGADVVITASRLRLGEIGGTAAGCSPERERQDVWLHDVFAADPAWSHDGEQLVLTTGDIEIILEPAPYW